MTAHEKTYDDGLRDGKIKSLEDISVKHSTRMDGHSKRMRSQEKVTWMMMGIIGLIQIVPAIIAIWAFFK